MSWDLHKREGMLKKIVKTENEIYAPHVHVQTMYPYHVDPPFLLWFINKKLGMGWGEEGKSDVKDNKGTNINPHGYISRVNFHSYMS